MSRRLEFHTLDVFTERQFGGNPLAVFLDGGDLPGEVMQQIAREMNLSESVFVLPARDPRALCRLRIFTPGRELPFAGHPTVGSGFLLAALGRIPLVEGRTSVLLDEDGWYRNDRRTNVGRASCSHRRGAADDRPPSRAVLLNAAAEGG
jgi:trans-2,3-dihydro-3-hydroxyanthranilate isomerase